jgi:hypothetical protein
MGNRYGKVILRWIYATIAYLLTGFILYYWMNKELYGLGAQPQTFSLGGWTKAIFFGLAEMGAGSFIMLILYNAIFSSVLLGGRSPRMSANSLSWIFLFLHVVLFVAIYYVMALNPYIWAFLLTGMLPLRNLLAYLIPTLFGVPFFIATRLWGPEIIAYRWPLFYKVRRKCGLQY